MLKFYEFKKMEIKVGTIIEAEKVANADKLVKLIVDFGSEKRQLVAGIGLQYRPEDLVGKQVPAIVNLEPVKLKGVESQGMILAVDPGEPVLLLPQKNVPNGSPVR